MEKDYRFRLDPEPELMTSFVIRNIPYVGYYDIIPGEFSIYLRKKPNFIHRWFTRVLLGWKWTDTKNNNN